MFGEILGVIPIILALYPVLLHKYPNSLGTKFKLIQLTTLKNAEASPI